MADSAPDNFTAQQLHAELVVTDLAPASESPTAGPAAETNVERRNRSRQKRLLMLLAKFAVSSALIYWILRGTSLSEIFEAVRGADVVLVITALSTSVIGYVILVNRWSLLLRAAGIAAPLTYLMKSYIVGLFFNQFLPSTIGGDAVRAYDSWRVGTTKVHAVVVVFVDRVLGMSALLAFSVVAALMADRVTEQVPLLLPVLAALLAAAVAFIVVATTLPAVTDQLAAMVRRLVPGNFGSVLARAFESFKAFRGKQGTLLTGFGLSLLLQANVVFQFFLIGQSLGFDVAFADYFLIVPVSLLIMALPISINAIGIRESVLTFFLGIYGVARTDAVALAWIAYGFLLAQALVGGVVYATRR